MKIHKNPWKSIFKLSTFVKTIHWFWRSKSAESEAQRQDQMGGLYSVAFAKTVRKPTIFYQMRYECSW